MGGIRKRKIINFSIKRQMQIRLFIKILGIILIGVGLMAAAFYLYSNREINASYRQFHVHADNFLDLLRPAIVSSLLLALFASVLITLFLPIKIAGPLYRIEREMKEKVAKGNLTVRFILRKGDEMGELAESINYCLESLGKKIETTQKLANDLEARMSQTEETDRRDMQDLVKKIKESLMHFTVR